MSNIKLVPITPDETFTDQGSGVIKRLEAYMVGEGGVTIQRDMNSTTQGWRRPPDFPMEYSRPRGNLQVKIFPKGRHTLKWQRVSGGTGPRAIRSRSPNKPMVFPRDYTPRTTPQGKWGGPGRRYGPKQVRHVVWHEIEPRKFSIIIIDRRGGKIIADMTQIAQRL